jgi:nucleotide-binding universal stress UspA family protein
MNKNNKSNFSKILVPLDGSRYAEKALLRAIEMVKSF